MSEFHALIAEYSDALIEIPDALRARKELEDEAAAHLTSGQHVCIRGFWRIGKTTLLKGMLKQACERSGGAAIYLDLRDPERDDGLPQTVQSVLGRIETKVNEFLKRVGAVELKADASQPLSILGELAAPIYVGFDELIALTHLGSEDFAKIVSALLATPKNVRAVVVCHRHRDADALFEEHVVLSPNMATLFVPSISDDELVQLVQTPAIECGVRFENEALGALAEISGNRPWEALSLCAIASAQLAPDFAGSIAAEKIDALLNLDVLADDEHGRQLVEMYLRILTTAMSADERRMIELLATGQEGEVSEVAIERLVEAGWIFETPEGYDINGGLMALVAVALAEGVIRVSIAERK